VPSVPGASAGRALFRTPACRFLLLFLAAALFPLAGCRKKQLTPAEIRSITREFVSAARNATSGKAQIGIWPENQPQPAGSRPRRGGGEISTDSIYITLAPGRSGQAEVEALRNELDRVAGQHGLKRGDVQALRGLVRFDYRRGDQRTHQIRIFTATAGGRAASARLAIILDDLGYDRGATAAVFALPYALTLSVLPNLPHSADVAEEADRRGYQVLLHLPMESANGGAKPEAIELRRGMQPGEVTRLLAEMLETVPHAVGVNNHQGSLATADAPLMAAVMAALRERQLFFIDSRTTTATVAYDAAVEARVPAASRKVFLDDIPAREAILRQLALAARHARQQGSAIAIGHPYPATLQALEEYLPQLEAQGIALVFASELVR
jgi:polysaccharide deacetylase 2 family uncharacterized protein YibQ